MHFKSRNVGLVVRLNSELYSPSFFTALGIQHLDMIFDDGTCPSLSLVRQFINLAHEVITVKKKSIAVHCKAGLGRTGCLIGAYLIYRYGFTASEIIAYMRFMRPGMVVGPQQHWLHLNQSSFREWWWEDMMKAKVAAMGPSTPTKVSHGGKARLASNGQVSTPPHGKRTPLGEVDNNETSVSVQEDYLPVPTPGQPRKTSRAHDRHHPYSRNVSNNCGSIDEAGNNRQTTEIVPIHGQSRGESESEDEWQRRMLMRRASSRSPGRRDEKRAVSCYTTTGYTQLGAGGDSDVENHVAGTPPQHSRSPARSGNGAGAIGIAKVRSSPRRSGDRATGKDSAGIRKTSGRVGSVSAHSPTSRKMSMQ
jgi:cell division cycle 14